MLEGLTVVSVNHVIIRGFGWCLWGYILAGVALLGLVLITTSSKLDSEELGVVGAALLGFGIICSLAVCSEGAIKNEYDTWKVLIDDCVSAKEFNERYNVLSVDGNVYEIVEWKNCSPEGRPNKYSITIEEVEE